MKRKIGYLVQVLIVGLIFFFLARNLYGNWEVVKESLSRFRFWWLLPTGLFLGLAFLMLVETWRWVLRGTGASLSFATACKIWFASNMGKYLPGKVWQILGMVYLSERRGVPKVKSFTSSVVSQFFGAVSGLLIGIIFLLIGGQRTLLGSAFWLWVILATLVALSGISLLYPSLVQGVMNFLLRLAKKEPVKFSFDSLSFLLYMLFYGVSWILFGVAFFFFSMGLVEPDINFLWLATAGFSIATVSGFLAVVVPAGLGVREGVLVLLLSGFVPSHIATLLALSYRVWFTLAEAVLFGISFLIKR